MRWSVAIIVLLLAAPGIAGSGERIVEVTAHKLNVRAFPSVKAPVVDQVSKGDRLGIIPVSDDWAALIQDGKRTGYISTRYVKAVKRNNETPGSAWVLFPVLLAIVFLVRAFRVRANKKQYFYNDSGFLQNKRERTSARTGAHSGETSSAQGESRSADQRMAASVTEEGRIQDLPVAKVEYVIDGDTIIVSSKRKKTKIRLDAIDCPENGQPWGDIAKAGLIKMTGGQWVHIEEHGIDHYGRVLATIYVQERHGSGWINVNEKMLIKGHAWVMRKYYDHLPAERRDRLVRMEKWARMKKVGLWKTANPVPPWKWRNNN